MATIACLITLIRPLASDRARLALDNSVLRQVESGNGHILATLVLCGLHRSYRQVA